MEGRLIPVRVVTSEHGQSRGPDTWTWRWHFRELVLMAFSRQVSRVCSRTFHHEF